MVDISVQNAFVVFESAHDASASETALSPVVLTVEHASSRIPPDWPSPSPSDAELLKKHWGIDIGAENLARELAAAISTANLANRGRQIVRGVAARFSRLLCDANRNLEEDEGVESDYRNGKRGDGGTMMRRTCEDGKVVVDMNADISQEERARRIALLYKPYHEAISSNLSALRTHMAINAPPVLVFSIHSFTDLYEGKKRTLEVGVLFRDEQDRELAEIMCRTLSASGFRAALNEPWSGDRFMHSANFHARKLGVPGMDEGREARALMIEARQDLLAGDAEWRARLVQGICRSLEEWYHSFI